MMRAGCPEAIRAVWCVPRQTVVYGTLQGVAVQSGRGRLEQGGEGVARRGVVRCGAAQRRAVPNGPGRSGAGWCGFERTGRAGLGDAKRGAACQGGAGQRGAVGGPFPPPPVPSQPPAPQSFIRAPEHSQHWRFALSGSGWGGIDRAARAGLGEAKRGAAGQSGALGGPILLTPRPPPAPSPTILCPRSQTQPPLEICVWMDEQFPDHRICFLVVCMPRDGEFRREFEGKAMGIQPRKREFKEKEVGKVMGFPTRAASGSASELPFYNIKQCQGRKRNEKVMIL